MVRIKLTLGVLAVDDKSITVLIVRIYGLTVIQFKVRPHLGPASYI